MRRAIAVKLRRWAQRLAPLDHEVIPGADGSAVIRFHSLPLARITAGQVDDQRPVKNEATLWGFEVPPGSAEIRDLLHALDPARMKAVSRAAVLGDYGDSLPTVPTACGQDGFVSTDTAVTCGPCKTKIASSAAAETHPAATQHYLLTPTEALTRGQGTACGGYGACTVHLTKVTCRACIRDRS